MYSAFVRLSSCSKAATIRIVAKKILMIAGPNGAGKTTLAKELIAKSPILYEFINADEIAKGLSPNHPDSVALMASKLMITRIKELLREGRSFAFETTLAGTNYIKHLKTAKALGYEVILFFLWLQSPEQAVKRVMQRVEQGGHFVPKETIKRRYKLGLKNLLNAYLSLADMAVIMNNSMEEKQAKIIAKQGASGVIDILNRPIWKQINETADGR